MTSAVAKPWSRDDFLEWEALQDERFEFVDGKVRSMVGETLDHNRIVLNTSAVLDRALDGTPCAVFAEGVKVEAAPDFYYPDLFVACGELDGESISVATPIVVIEVLSKSTRAYDRGRKRAGYQSIASLRHYVLISQYERKVEVFTRSEQDWSPVEYVGRDADVVLTAIDVVLSFAEIYRRTRLDPGRAAGAEPA
jgi:Uma2 family endonuclease